MAFADHLPVDGRLLWWGLEVSTDNFATISYRWATHSGDVEGSFFDQRLVSVGNIQRGLGANHLPVAATTTVVIDNTDFGVDWLANRATVASALFKARFRLKLGLATPGDGAAVLTQKLGTFVCLDFPRRKDGFIQLSLADDSIGLLADTLVPPSPRDWFDTAPGTTNSVFPSNIGNVEPLCDWGIPAPLQFGRPDFIGQGLATFSIERTPGDYDTAGGFETGHRKYIYPILVCATRDTAGVTADDVTQLEGVYRSDVTNDPYGFATRAAPLIIPATFNNYNIWKAYKTASITKDGYAWKLLWVAFDCYNYTRWLISTTVSNLPQGVAQSIPSSPDYPPANAAKPPPGSPPAALLPPFIPYRTYFAAFDYFRIKGAPGSGITGKSDLSNVGDPLNILQDLVESYSALGSGSIDTTRFARAQLVTKLIATGRIYFGDAKSRSDGTQQLSDRRSPYGIGALRKAIAELAASMDLDIFLTMDGKVAAVTQGADFETQTTTYTALDEERINNVEDHIPSQGERWSPYNRLFLAGNDEEQAGPYDDPGGAIASWGRVLPKVLGTKWWWNYNYIGAPQSLVANVWQYRNVQAIVRPVITFTTDVSVLALELGDYFTMSWTRGGENSLYASTLWRLESVKVNPENGEVEVSAVWMDDLTTYQPFLLDNETLIVRTAPGFGQTLTVTDGSDTVTRSAGDFDADGVTAGDILRIRDTSEAATTFYRNRDIRVLDVLGATSIQLDTADTDFGTAGAHVIADTDWKIVRGATTYHTAVSDPTNYPSGGAMYGKIGNASGLFSNSTDANKLLDG